jgi:hypothetical protein
LSFKGAWPNRPTYYQADEAKGFAEKFFRILETTKQTST